jgi:hypothetical protein
MPKCVTYFLLEPILVSLGPTFSIFFLCIPKKRYRWFISHWFNRTKQDYDMLIAYLRCMGHTPSSKVDCIENGFPLLGCADDLFFFYWTKNTPLFRGISRICLLFLGGFRRRKSKMIYRDHGLDKCSMYGSCATFTPKITQM